MPSARVPNLYSATSVLNGHLGKNVNIALEDVFASRDPSARASRRTKIVCTLGPACRSVNTLIRMIDAGMDVARLNFAHGDHHSHSTDLKLLREAMRLRPRRRIGLMMDTCGPEIRTGPLSRGQNQIQLKQGQQLRIVTDKIIEGDESTISCTYSKLGSKVKIGQTILIDDGNISCEVYSVDEHAVMTTVLNPALLGAGKRLVVPNLELDTPPCGAQDVYDLLRFCIPNQMHYIGLSYTRCAQDIRDVRRILGQKGRHVKIIPKLETCQSLVNLDEIIAEADGVAMDRGDLSMELPSEKTFLAQKLVIHKSNMAGKPVIMMTQMLETMKCRPRPTGAEVSDVANAVLDGTDCVMLASETADGLYPVKAVEVLAKVCLEAESCIDYPALFNSLHAVTPGPVTVPEAICCSAVETAEGTNAKLIVALTETGHTARLLAKYRPRTMILALASSDITVSQLSLIRGVVPVKVDSFRGTESVINKALATGKVWGYLSRGDVVVAVHGLMEEVAGHTNLLKVVVCP